MPTAPYSKALRADISAIAPADRTDQMLYFCKEIAAPYQFDSASTASADNDLVLMPSDNPGSGRWMRLGALLNRDQAYTARQRPVPVTLSSSGGSVTLNTALSSVFILTLTENTLINVSNLLPGTQIELHLINGATAYTVSFSAEFDFGSTVPTAIGANKSDILVASSREGTKLRASIAKGFGV